MQYDLNQSMQLASTQEEITQEILYLKEQQGMRRRRKHYPTVWRLALIVGDGVLLVVLLALVLMFTPHFNLVLGVSSYMFGVGHLKIVWIALELVIWIIANKITHAQEMSIASNRFKSPLYALFALLLMLILSMGLIFSTINNEAANIKMLLFFLLLAIPAFSVWRLILAQVMGLERFRPLGVIAGANNVGEALARELQCAKRPTATILGYIDEGSKKEITKLAGLPILGGRSVLRYLAQSDMIDMIIVALDYKTNPELFKEFTEAAQLGIAVLPMAVIYESNSGKIPVEHVSDNWYVALPSEPITSTFYLCWKKMIDLVSGFCGLLLLCILAPILALLIRLDSTGPIFYSQNRLGLHGIPFRIYKFRSMRVDAENEGHAVWANNYDQRITRVGRFLRVTHLDESPQLLNILRGDMSLIGPRPERAEFVAELEKTIPFYRYRLVVKPGLTGWAQVKYHYGKTANDALIKLQYDLYYIKRQSFMLDIFIIIKTVIEVLFSRGT